MTDPRDNVWEDRAERTYTDLTYKPKRTLGKWFVIGLAIIVGLSVLGGVLGLLGAWGGEAKKLAGPDHSREQVTLVLDDWESLGAAVDNVCDTASDVAQSDGAPVLIEKPGFAYRSQYRTIKARYDRRMNNFFEAAVTRRLPIPDGLRELPRRAPRLEDRLKEQCPSAL